MPDIPYPIYGILKDCTGNPIMDVEITITNNRTLATLVVITNEDGEYIEDAANFDGGYLNGDSIEVSCSYATNTGVIDVEVGMVEINITVLCTRSFGTIF